jgi:serine/threonine protein kinase
VKPIHDSMPGLEDKRVLEAVRTYQELIESGQRPDRDEFLSRHPDIALVLAECLDGLDFVQGVVEDLEDPDACPDLSSVSSIRPEQPLGDFRILREVGRGGMGVVYEAVQLSLGRRVALKVLPFASALDPRQLQRFRNEAQAAAQLHHPNIVPVYGLGYDRGIHYFAMQFIEGRTLAEIIEDLRKQPPSPDRQSSYARFLGKNEKSPAPAPRSPHHYFAAIARFGLQAAEGLEHAHQLGMVHRDIKPANLMIDSGNEVWITDFGLARCRSDQDLTRSGDVVGTLRYMSPEQAKAWPGVVDHRSDIYSLGITLYEALTLEPAFASRDRAVLLSQLYWGEPKAIRARNPAIPVELETIVQKAMARDPARRYASAQELADDLQCFLEHRPIKARRPTFRERSLDWAWRHRQLVSTAVGVLLLSVIGLLTASGLLWQEKERTRAALATAQAEGQHAEENFHHALDGIMKLLWELEEPRWANMPRILELRREMTNKALVVLQEFVHEDSTDPAVLFESARAYRELANIHCAYQEGEQALAMIQKATAIFKKLVAEHPETPAYRRHLVNAYHFRGVLCLSLQQPLVALEPFRGEVEQYRALLPFDERGVQFNRLAWILAMCPLAELRDPSEAVSLAQQAVALAPDEADYWNTLGVAQYRTGDYAQATETLRKSMEIGKGGEPCDWFFMAMIEWQRGDKAQARSWYEKGDRWMQTKPPQSDDWFLCMEEAAKMLGIRIPIPSGKK